MAAIVVVAVEAASWVAGRWLQERHVFYRPVCGDDYAGYLARRDPVVGWPSPRQEDVGGIAGARPRPCPPLASVRCGTARISLYGDSFAYGLGVADDEAWASVLAQKVGCPVANYGVSGYGTDQAYLRYRSNAADSAEVVLLGVMAENVIRNVMQFKDIIYPKEFYSLKPRFVPGPGGQLELVPLPQVPAQEYPEMVANPERYFPYDYFRPGGPSRVDRLRFPYSWRLGRTALRLVQHQFLGGGRLVDVVYADFYRPDHPAQALAVTAGICALCAETARGRGAQVAVVLMPDRQSLATFLASGEWVYQPLADELERRGIPWVNVGPNLACGLAGQAYPAVLADAAVRQAAVSRLGAAFGADGHYGAAANRDVAEAVASWLGARGLPRRRLRRRLPARQSTV
jgi:hypothetical protein